MISGQDARGMAGQFVDDGWERVRSPENPMPPAGVVDLGFVLNAIGNPVLRLEALSATELTSILRDFYGVVREGTQL